MKTLILFVSVLICSLLLSISGYTQTQQWAVTQDFSSSEILENTLVDNSGNTYLCGETIISGGTYRSMYISKYNSAGTYQWGRSLKGVYFGAPNNRGTNAYTSVLDNSGNAYVAGTSDSSFSANKGYIAKFNPNGDSVWCTYAGVNDTIGFVEWYSMKIDNSGNLYVAGINFKSNFSVRTYIVAKYNSSGVLQWVVNQYPPLMRSTRKIGFTLQLDNANNVYIASSLQKSLATGSTDFYVFKLNNAGAFQWSSTYNGPADAEDYVSSMVLDASGNVYVEGTGMNIIPIMKEITCIKYSGSTGAQQWLYNLNGVNGGGDESAFNIAVGINNDVYLSCSLFQNTVYDDGALIKLNASSGTEVWKKIFKSDGTGANSCNDVKVLSSGIIYAVGAANNGSSTNSVYTRKLNLAGDSLSASSYSVGTNASAIPKFVTPAMGNSLYISGDVTVGSNIDAFLVKYGVTTSITPVQNIMPDDFSLLQNYPNPFNPSTKISYNLKTEGLVSLKVFDLNGKEVANLVNENQKAGRYELNFDAGKYSLSSGIYFYKISASGFTDTKRMILVK